MSLYQPLCADDTLTLKAGLKPRDGVYKREMGAATLTLVSPPGVTREVIEIAPRGLWPISITLWAEGNITFEIVVAYAPDGRPPTSITWLVNNVEKRKSNSVPHVFI